MTAGLVDVILRASVLLGAAALADFVLGRRASAATRHLAWSLAIAALLVLPLASLALPSWQLRIPVARPPVAAVATPVDRVVASTSCTDAAQPGCAAAPRDAVAPAAGAARSPLVIAAVVAAVLYLGGGLLLLARFALEPLALRRLTRASLEIADPVWCHLLANSRQQLGVRRPVRLLQSAVDVMPMTFGTLTPVIVLPASADDWPVDRRRAVILHELAHVARRDCLIQRMTALACALYWPHPGVWWAARRLRVERELACDDRVLAAGTAARDYAGHLLDLAHSLTPAPGTALGMARARQLEHRLVAILDAARNRTALDRRGRTAALALAVALFVPMAALRAAIVRVDVPESTSGETQRSASAAPSTGQEFTGTWELQSTRNAGVFQVSVRSARGSHGRTVRLDQLAGLPTDKIASTDSAPVHFPIRREAGTFTVDGVCRSGACGGTFVFAPDPAFADMLAKRGIGRPTPEEQFSLAIANVGAAYLDELAAAGYGKPDVATLVRAAQHGVDIDYLRGMGGLGYRAGSLDALITLRDHGVDPEYIRGMQDAGFAHLSVDDLRRARDHGVDPEYARGMAALGFRDLPLTALVNARDHGVDPEYVRGMQAVGVRLTLDDYLRTRNHGIDPEYVRGMQGLGYRLTLDQYLEARNHGVDPEYIRGMQTLGYNGAGVDALVAARNHGVDAEYVRRMAEVGYKGIALTDLIRLRDHGVDADYVRRVQQSGAPRPSVDDIIRRRDRGDGDPDATVQAVAARIRAIWHNVRALLSA